MIFETHAHYDDNRFDGDRDELLSSLKSRGIEYVINIGADMQSSRASVELASRYDFVYCSVGVHPHEAKAVTESDYELLAKYCENERVVAVGEAGLDFYYDNSPRDCQCEVFRRQLELAKAVGKPIVIHSRDACEQTLTIVRESGVARGVVHCFSGSVETAEAYVKLGYFIGIDGPVTFKNARRLTEVVQKIPLEYILLETDCPYLSPEPNRGKRNDSTNLPYIARKVAEIKGVSYEEVCEVTKQNAIRLFFDNRQGR